MKEKKKEKQIAKTRKKEQKNTDKPFLKEKTQKANIHTKIFASSLFLREIDEIPFHIIGLEKAFQSDNTYTRKVVGEEELWTLLDVGA